MTDELKFSAKAEYTGYITEGWIKGVKGPPQVYFTSNDNAVTNFTVVLATNPKKDDAPMWFAECTAWGSKAEKIAELPLGTWVTLRGKQKIEFFQDREQVWQSKIILTLHDGADALIIHDQADNPIVGAVKDLGGTVTQEKTASEAPPPF